MYYSCCCSTCRYRVSTRGVGGGSGREVAEEAQQKPVEQQQEAQDQAVSEPQEKAVPEPPPGQAKPITLSGNQTSASEFFQLESGLTVFKMTHE